MKIEVFLRPRGTVDDNDPGHMALCWSKEEDYQRRKANFRGFFFNPLDLPEEYQNRSKWRDYLFNHAVAGYVKNDIAMQDDVFQRAAQLKSKQFEKDSIDIAAFEETTRPRKEGRYSFNPDTHNCHNCVTWVLSVMNSFFQDAFKPVREGRIKEIASQFD